MGLAKRDRAGLQALDGGLGLVFGQAHRALDAARLGARHIAGDACDFRVVIGVDHDLVVGPDPLEDGVDFADGFGQGGKRGTQQGQEEDAFHAAIVSASRLGPGHPGAGRS
jgi:hypothetical protein